MSSHDVMRREPIAAFWRAVLAYEVTQQDELADADKIGPTLWFQQMDQPRPSAIGSISEVWVAHDEASQRVEAALAAGGRMVSDEHAPAFWVLADGEGNEVCVCTWQDRESASA